MFTTTGYYWSYHMQLHKLCYNYMSHYCKHTKLLIWFHNRCNATITSYCNKPDIVSMTGLLTSSEGHFHRDCQISHFFQTSIISVFKWLSFPTQNDTKEIEISGLSKNLCDNVDLWKDQIIVTTIHAAVFLRGFDLFPFI